MFSERNASTLTWRIISKIEFASDFDEKIKPFSYKKVNCHFLIYLLPEGGLIYILDGY